MEYKVLTRPISTDWTEIDGRVVAVLNDPEPNVNGVNQFVLLVEKHEAGTEA